MPRDAMNTFGTVALTASSAVTLPNVIDFGPIDERTGKAAHRTGEQHDSSVVFAVDAVLAANITSPKLEHSDDNASFTDLIIGPAVSAGKPSGVVLVLPFPLEHKRYVRASATGGGAGNNLSVWFEPGPNHG